MNILIEDGEGANFREREDGGGRYKAFFSYPACQSVTSLTSKQSPNRPPDQNLVKKQGNG